MGVQRRSVAAIELFVGAGDEADRGIVFARQQIDSHAALPMILRIPSGDRHDARVAGAAHGQPAARLQTDVALAIGKQPHERRMRPDAHGFHRGGRVGRADHVEPSADRPAALGLLADPRHRQILAGPLGRDRACG